MEDGLAGYFESFWNYVDVTAFTMQILVDLEVILGFGVTILRPMSAVSLLCLFVKILYFARGFGRWGTQVKMMFKILEDMQPFLLILMVFVSGFGVAFWIVLHDENESFSEPGKSITYVLNLAVYGQGELDPMDNTYLTASFGQILMLFISLVLLNMLIAIMSDTFDHCVKTAQVDNVVAKAEIVLEMEEIWLPTLSRHVPESAKYYIKRWFDLDLVDVRANLSTRKVFYPKYLHVLKPTIARGEESGGMSGSASAEGGALQSTSPINGGSRHRATDEGQRLAELTPFERCIVDSESRPTVAESLADALNEMEDRLGTSMERIEKQQSKLPGEWQREMQQAVQRELQSELTTAIQNQRAELQGAIEKVEDQQSELVAALTRIEMQLANIAYI